MNQARNLTAVRLSVNEEFRNEIAKTSPILALSEEFNEPLNARMKKLATGRNPNCFLALAYGNEIRCQSGTGF